MFTPFMCSQLTWPKEDLVTGSAGIRSLLCLVLLLVNLKFVKAVANYSANCAFEFMWWRKLNMCCPNVTFYLACTRTFNLTAAATKSKFEIFAWFQFENPYAKIGFNCMLTLLMFLQLIGRLESLWTLVASLDY